LQQVKNVLTEKQYRRLWWHFADGISLKQIAQRDGVTLRAIYACFAKAEAAIVNKL